MNVNFDIKALTERIERLEKLAVGFESAILQCVQHSNIEFKEGIAIIDILLEAHSKCTT